MSWGTAGGTRWDHTCKCCAALPGAEYHRPCTSRKALLAPIAFRYSRTYICGPCTAHKVQHGMQGLTMLMT